MSHIPKALLKLILLDPWYKKCCLEGDDCSGRIQYHHNLIFGGKQVQELFAILPVCEGHHEDARHTEIKEKLDLVMLKRASLPQLIKYSKAVNLLQRLLYLENKHEGN